MIHIIWTWTQHNCFRKDLRWSLMPNIFSYLLCFKNEKIYLFLPLDAIRWCQNIHVFVEFSPRIQAKRHLDRFLQIFHFRKATIDQFNFLILKRFIFSVIKTTNMVVLKLFCRIKTLKSRFFINGNRKL